ncbi:DNA polymerase delta catalytic subunit [Perkinsela sp. CCAP 1560/4]|nr:DNA polymerase delta catalytic subunit [Perkinsela sp. CCAP 1560/4]|eukprot:KNH04195.1 DNA polymerase delta catalytic subunit [Perkinsela sp. CCAP 1560/4]
MQTLHCSQFFGPPSRSVSRFHTNEVPIVRLYGSTMAGNSVLFNIYNFEPYLWIEEPIELGPSWDVEYFRKMLNESLEASTRSRSAIVRIEKDSRSSLLYYNIPGQSHSSFLKIVCELPGQISKLRGLLEGGVNIPRIWNAPRSFNTYESNVLFPLRFLVDCNVGGSNWVRIPAGGYTPTPKPTSSCQIEVDVSYEKILPFEAHGEWMKIAPFRILSIDIECKGRKGCFPEPSQDPVIQISFQGISTLQSTEDQTIDIDDPDCHEVCTSRCQKVFTLGSCSSIAGCTVHSYDSEEEMLNAFAECLKSYDPDFLTGYNVSNFDFPYLIDRAAALKQTNTFCTWGRLYDERTAVKEKAFSSKQAGNRVFKDLVCDGRIVLDVITCIQKDYKLRSYSLNSVSQFFLREQKEDVHHSIIADLQDGDEETRRRLAVYCLKDALLPLRLIEKLMLLINNIEMARVAGIPISWLLERGQQIKVFSQMLRKAKNRKLLFPTTEGTAQSEDASSFEGATVIEPKRGFYEKPIATLDFASLYPSIMMAHNLCYSTLIRPAYVKQLDPSTYSESPSGHFFIKDAQFRGILPEILRELLDARKIAKKAMAEAKDALEYAVLNGRQNALKISANSVYGFTGAQFGRLRCLEISASVTAFGRQMIDQTKAIIEKQYTTENGYPGNATVIYGDTDSVMINFNCFPDGCTDREYLESSMKLGKEASALVSKTFIQPIRLDFEKVYFPYMLMSKKRYAGLLWTNSTAYDKLDVKGIESVRRDNCPLVANIVGTVLNHVLIDRSVPQAVQYVKRTISDLLMNRLDISLLVISKTFSKSEDAYVGKQSHIALVERIRKRDPLNAPVIGDRVAYVIIKGPKGAKLYEKSEDPIYVLQHNIAIDAQYYLDHQLSLPIQRLFEGIIESPESLIQGSHTRHISIVTPSKAAGGIMKFAKVNLQCLACRTPMTATEKGAVCTTCKPKEMQVFLRHIEKRNHYESLYARVWTECQRCQGSLHEEVLCSSKDCPVFYMRKKVQADLREEQTNVNRFQTLEW